MKKYIILLGIVGLSACVQSSRKGEPSDPKDSAKQSASSSSNSESESVEEEVEIAGIYSGADNVGMESTIILKKRGVWSFNHR